MLVLHFLFLVSNYIMECVLLHLKLFTVSQPRWSQACVCFEAGTGGFADPKWRQFQHARKRYPPTALAPISTLVLFPKHFRPVRPHTEVKGRSKTARMGWRRGLNRNRIWYFDGMRPVKQAYRYTNGLLKVRNLWWRWNSYAVNQLRGYFSLFFFGRLFFGLQGFIKLALASILLSCFWAAMVVVSLCGCLRASLYWTDGNKWDHPASAENIAA